MCSTSLSLSLSLSYILTLKQVLLIPPSRFRDWNFANPEGQTKLCDDQGFSRMIIVRMHPSYTHNVDDSNFKSVRSVLSFFFYGRT